MFCNLFPARISLNCNEQIRITIPLEKLVIHINVKRGGKISTPPVIRFCVRNHWWLDNWNYNEYINYEKLYTPLLHGGWEVDIVLLCLFCWGSNTFSWLPEELLELISLPEAQNKNVIWFAPFAICVLYGIGLRLYADVLYSVLER